MKRFFLILGILFLSFIAIISITTYLSNQRNNTEINKSPTLVLEEQIESVDGLNSLFSLLAWIFIYKPFSGLLLLVLIIIFVLASVYFGIKVLGLEKIGKLKFKNSKTNSYIEKDILFLFMEQSKFLQKIIPLQNVILHEQLERVEKAVGRLSDTLDNTFVDFLIKRKGETIDIYEDKDYFSFFMFKVRLEDWIIDEMKYYLKKNNLLEKTNIEFKQYTDNIYEDISNKIQERITKAFKFNLFTQKELIDLFCNHLADNLKDAVRESFKKAKEIKIEFMKEMEKDLHVFYEFARNIYERQGWNYDDFKKSFQLDLHLS
jgi:hypothetical protein